MAKAIAGAIWKPQPGSAGIPWAQLTELQRRDAEVAALLAIEEYRHGR